MTTTDHRAARAPRRVALEQLAATARRMLEQAELEAAIHRARLARFERDLLTLEEPNHDDDDKETTLMNAMTDPHQMGSRLGRGWAATTRTRRIAMRSPDGQLVDAVAEIKATGRIPDPLRDLVLRAGGRNALAGLDDEARDQFWAGFVSGVRSWLDEQAGAAERGMSPN